MDGNGWTVAWGERRKPAASAAGANGLSGRIWLTGVLLCIAVVGVSVAQALNHSRVLAQQAAEARLADALNLAEAAFVAQRDALTGIARAATYLPTMQGPLHEADAAISSAPRATLAALALAHPGAELLMLAPDGGLLAQAGAADGAASLAGWRPLPGIPQQLRWTVSDGRGRLIVALCPPAPAADGCVVAVSRPDPFDELRAKLGARATAIELAFDSIAPQAPADAVQASRALAANLGVFASTPLAWSAATAFESGWVFAGSALLAAVAVAVAFLLRRWLWQPAYRDGLTGLPNRMAFEERLERVLTLAARHGERCALLFVDLDEFKHVNDSLGHAAGDRLLVEVAQRIENCVRDSDLIGGPFVARLGGDEFLVVLPQLRDPETARVVAWRVHESLQQPIPLGGKDVVVGASIGISVFPDSAADAATLIGSADRAMYRAKARGKNTCEYGEGVALALNKAGIHFAQGIHVNRMGALLR